MKYLAFFLCALLFACQSPDTEKKKDPNQEKISTLEAKIQQYDSILQIGRDFELSLKNIELYCDKWVSHQSNSDDQDKIKLLDAEKAGREHLSQLTQNTFKEIQENSQEINEHFENLMAITSEIKKTLPDFASYENPESMFLAQALIDVDGEFHMIIRKIYYNLQAIMQKTTLQKRKLQLEIEKLKRK